MSIPVREWICALLTCSFRHVRLSLLLDRVPAGTSQRFRLHALFVRRLVVTAGSSSAGRQAELLWGLWGGDGRRDE